MDEVQLEYLSRRRRAIIMLKKLTLWSVGLTMWEDNRKWSTRIIWNFRQRANLASLREGKHPLFIIFTLSTDLSRSRGRLSSITRQSRFGRRRRALYVCSAAHSQSLRNLTKGIGGQVSSRYNAMISQNAICAILRLWRCKCSLGAL
jgi:hypothetical protein